MQKITPFLWFNDQAEEAANYYVSIFNNSKITEVTRAGDQVTFVSFELDGRAYMALNGGPYYSLTPAFSLFVNCADQAEVDSLWQRMIADGGEESRCGWLVDKFGLSWQIVPQGLNELLYGPDSAGSQRAVQAMLQMSKLDLAAIQAAYDGD